LATIRAFFFEVLAAVPARLARIGFKFAQPSLIKRIIEVEGSTSSTEFEKQMAGSLVGATALVYTGIALYT
jgi:ATP-binding cassette, subfamily C (CFTR/MRP), member 1